MKDQTKLIVGSILSISALVGLIGSIYYYNNSIKDSVKLNNINEKDTNTNDIKKKKGQDNLKKNNKPKEQEIVKDLKIPQDSDEKPSIESSKKYGAIGTSNFKKKNYVKAIEAYTQAISLTPKKRPEEKKVLLNNRAAAFDKINKTKESIEDCTLALQLDPLYIRALTRRARILEADNQFTNALNDLALIFMLKIARNEQLEEAKAQKMDYLIQVVANEEVDEILAKRDIERKNDDFLDYLPRKSFITTYLYSFCNETKKIRSPPSTTKVKLCKTELDQLLQEPDKETDEYKIKKIEKLNQLATLLKYRKEYNESARMFKSILDDQELVKILKSNDQLKLTCANILLNQGTFLHLSGFLKEAKDVLLEAFKYNEKSINTLIKLAGISIELNEREECLNYFEKAKLIIDDENDIGVSDGSDIEASEITDYYFHFGLYFLINEDYKAALENIMHSLDAQPTFAMGYMQLGIIYFRLGNATESLEAFEKACMFAPEMSEIYTYRGEVYMAQGDMEKADEQFIQSNTLDPHNAGPFTSRGVKCVEEYQNVGHQLAKIVGDPTKQDQIPILQKELKDIGRLVLKYFDQAIKVDPFTESTYIHKATFVASNGELAKALEYCNKAISLAKTKIDLKEYCIFKASCEAQLRAKKIMEKRM